MLFLSYIYVVCEVPLYQLGCVFISDYDVDQIYRIVGSLCPKSTILGAFHNCRGSNLPGPAGSFYLANQRCHPEYIINAAAVTYPNKL